MCSSLTHSGRPCKNGSSCHIHALTGPECAICLNPTTRTRTSQKLKCGHVFHGRCINNWRNAGGTTCPTCRAIINPAKYRVTLSVENVDTGASNSVPLSDASIISLFNGLGVQGLPNFHTEIGFEMFGDREIQNFLEDLHVRFSDLDALIFDTEGSAVR